MVRKNTKGSTLVAAVIVIMVVMIILGAALTISSSYYKRSIHENVKKQVYLSAKSGANVISQYIIEGEEKLIPNANEIISFQLETGQDHIAKEGSITRVDEKTIKIVMKATLDDTHKDNIQMILILKDGSWQVYSYCEAKEGNALC